MALASLKRLICNNRDALLMSDSMNLSVRGDFSSFSVTGVWLRDRRAGIYFGHIHVLLHLPPIQGRINELPSSY